ncbi:MAG TPA: cytochrome c [Gemmataceae bacterium]|nr:cytochrome c [Gemmataceae bacterium]
MHTQARRLTAVGLTLGLAFLTGDGGQAANEPQPISGEMVLTRIEPDELTRSLHKIIQEELKAPGPDGRGITKVRASALLIASHAQSGRGARDISQRTALRDNALKLQKALADGRIDAARKQAGGLFDLGSMSAGTRRVDLKQLAELDEVESLWGPRRRGGLGFGSLAARDGLEIKLITLTRKPLPAATLAAEAAELARAASITAAMATLLDEYAPIKKVGNKDPMDWKAATDAMRAGAGELEEAAKAGDATGVKAAAIKVFTSCNNCHSVFRD